MKNNKGFTLIEMLVTILAAAVVSAAALTILLMGMRIHQKTNSAENNQSSISIAITMLEELAAEQCTGVIDGNTVGKKDGTLFCFKNNTIYIGDENGSPILTGVESFSADWEKDKDGNKVENLLTFSIVMENGQEYTSSVYCRIADSVATTPSDEADGTGNNEESQAAASAAAFSSTPQTLSEILEFNALDRQFFLEILTAEEGSTGKASSGEYFSEWYIGSYQDNPGWNPETPWCACFLSWALDQCRTSLEEVPRYAHVDKFLEFFDESHWKTENPQPGDIIFFDWIVDDQAIPQHVGAVVDTDGEFVYTIEGNNEGKVASCRYRLDDARILGYGVLNWK